MAEIATWSAILNKTGLGKTSNECPTKAELLALNNGKNSNTDKLIAIANASTYGNNECVKLEDVYSEQWVYTLEWNYTTSFNAPATGGTYSYKNNRINSIRTKYKNGSPTYTSENVAYTENSHASWYTIDSSNERIIVPNNTTTSSRTHTYLVTQQISGKQISARFYQDSGSKFYGNWSYNCRVDKTSFSYSGGQANVTAKTASRSYTWNGVAGSGGTESQTATVTVTSPASISGNTITIPSNSDSARSFTVTFAFSTATNQTISISQEGGQVSYVDHLSIQPTYKTVEGDGGTFSVVVDANYDKYLNGVYQENISASYSTAEVTEGDSSNITITKTSSGCNITVAPNPDENSGRNFKIKFTYDSATPVYLEIFQYRGVVTHGKKFLSQSKSQNGNFTTDTLRYGKFSNAAGSITVYVKAYIEKYINGVFVGYITNEEELYVTWHEGKEKTLIDDSNHIFKIVLNYPENTDPLNEEIWIYTIWDGSGTQLQGSFSQEVGNPVYEFYLTDKNGNGKYEEYTYNCPVEGIAGLSVCKLVSTVNGNTVRKNVTVMASEIWCKLTTGQTSSPFTYVGVIGSNSLGTTTRATRQEWTQEGSGKKVTLWIQQDKPSIKAFTITLGLNITNGSDDDVWGLFGGPPLDGGDYGYTSLTREGIYETSDEEGFITINSADSGASYRINVGQPVYVAAYNSTLEYWDVIDHFFIQEGDNSYTYTHTWSR